MRTFQLMLGEDLTPLQLRFAVELAHLIGFSSMALTFPLVSPPGVPVDPEAVCFYLGSTPPAGENVVHVVPGGGKDDAGLWASLYRRYVPASPRAALRPRSFVSATENTLAEEELPVRGGLEQLFERGWILLDRDRDGLADDVDCRFLLPQEMELSLCRAACDLAARLGMETAGIRYPLTAEEDDGASSLIVFRGGGVPPALILEQETPRKRVVLEGCGPDLETFAAQLAQTFPLARDNLRLVDVTRRLEGALSLKNADGQAAWLEAQGMEAALLSADADLEKFCTRWPGTEFHHFNDPSLREERTYSIPWEVETAQGLLSEVCAQLRPGDRVELRGALGQDRPERETLVRNFCREAAQQGARVERADIVCAFKPGLSWLEESFAPTAARVGGTRRVVVRFHPHQRTAVTYGQEAFDWTEIDRKVGKPPRWLQELYPADELMADILGISRDDVFFEAYPGALDATYEALALDQEGRCLLRDTWTVRTHARPYLDALPQLGPALNTTGFLQALVNGEPVLDTRVVTDCEAIWDVFQSELISWLRETAEAKGLRAENQPFFSCLELEIGLGGPERRLNTRNDHISIGEALEDNLHQAAHLFFMCWGRTALKENLDAPGLVLPRIRIRPGRPTLRAALYLPWGDRPSFPAGESRCRCSRVSLQAGRLQLEMDCEADPSPALPALAKLTGEGFTDLSRLLADYGSLVLSAPDQRWEIPLPEVEPAPPSLDIRDIDLMPDRPIGYDDYRRIMLQLARVPGLQVYPVGWSYQGRTVYALEPESRRQGYVSRVKRLQYHPVVLINGRHHANEVSATNAIFAFIRELVTNRQYQDVGEELNLVFLPMENVDGAALHDTLQKEHPCWEHRVSYATPQGADLMSYYFRPSAVCPEAGAFTRLAESLLPDAFIDLHGVPHHELTQQFDQLTGYKGLWLPRTPLCAFYFHIDDARFASNRDLSLAWKAAVDRQYAQWTAFASLSEEYEQRFTKYAWGGIDESYPCKRSGPMLDYWVPSLYNARHPYPTISRPWTFSVMFTAEAADETAHGPWLQFCAQAHLAHVRAGVALMRSARVVMEDIVSAADGRGQIKYLRCRPVLAP